MKSRIWDLFTIFLTLVWHFKLLSKLPMYGSVGCHNPMVYDEYWHQRQRGRDGGRGGGSEWERSPSGSTPRELRGLLSLFVIHGGALKKRVLDPIFQRFLETFLIARSCYDYMFLVFIYFFVGFGKHSLFSRFPGIIVNDNSSLFSEDRRRL